MRVYNLVAVIIVTTTPSTVCTVAIIAAIKNIVQNVIGNEVAFITKNPLADPNC